MSARDPLSTSSEPTTRCTTCRRVVMVKDLRPPRGTRCVHCEDQESDGQENPWEPMRRAVAKRTGLDDAGVEVILRRISDRLGGFTHDEVVARHPLPEDTDDS